MNEQMRYESFVRSAFGFPGEMIGRHEDPAGAADADRFYPGNLAIVRTAVAYAMMIINSAIVERQGETLEDDESIRMDDFVMRASGADTLEEISRLMEEYETTVANRHFAREHGVVVWK